MDGLIDKQNSAKLFGDWTLMAHHGWMDSALINMKEVEMGCLRESAKENDRRAVTVLWSESWLAWRLVGRKIIGLAWTRAVTLAMNLTVWESGSDEKCRLAINTWVSDRISFKMILLPYLYDRRQSKLENLVPIWSHLLNLGNSLMLSQSDFECTCLQHLLLGNKEIMFLGASWLAELTLIFQCIK